MLEFDLISDFHAEMNRPWEEYPNYDGWHTYYPWHLEKQSDVLVIAGDCSNDPSTTCAVLGEAASVYPHVLFVDGNHEHYIGYTHRDATVGVNQQWLRDFAAEHANVTYLEETGITRFGSTAFIGCNGWYDWMGYHLASREQQRAYWKKDSNDSRCIRFDKMPDKMARYQADQLRLRVEELAQDDTIERIVVVTHTIPHTRGLIPHNHPFGYLNGSYTNTAMEQVWLANGHEKITAWVYGHTHFHADFDAEGIRFINNARGYRGEGNGFVAIRKIDLTETSAWSDR